MMRGVQIPRFGPVPVYVCGPLIAITAAGCSPGAAPARAPTPRVADAGASLPTALLPIGAMNVSRLERLYGAYDAVEDVRFGDDGVLVTTTSSVWLVRPD